MGQENRRVSVNDRTPTFSQLMELLESLFGPQTRECYVKYKDTEGDVVTSTHEPILLCASNCQIFQRPSLFKLLFSRSEN